MQLKRVEPDGVSITHSVGAEKVLFREIPRSIAVKYGYEPESAGFYERLADDTRELAEILYARLTAYSIIGGDTAFSCGTIPFLPIFARRSLAFTTQSDLG